MIHTKPKIVLACIMLLSFIGLYTKNLFAQESNTADTACIMRYYNEKDDPKTEIQVVRPSFKPLVDRPAVTVPKPTPEHIQNLISQYASQFNVDTEKMKRIAACESGFNPGAINGPYGGMYQYLSSTWSSTRKEMGLDPDPDLRFNAEESIKTTAYKISKQGTGPWPVCGKS